jgi:hypothetical protein
MKVKFYQFKRLGFTKIASLVTLEFDLVFLHIFFADFYHFFWNFETVNSILMDLKFRSTWFRRFSPNFKKFGRFFSRFGCPRDLVRLAPRLGPALAYLTFSPAVEADGASAHAHAKKKMIGTVFYFLSTHRRSQYGTDRLASMVRGRKPRRVLLHLQRGAHETQLLKTRWGVLDGVLQGRGGRAPPPTAAAAAFRPRAWPSPSSSSVMVLPLQRAQNRGAVCCCMLMEGVPRLLRHRRQCEANQLKRCCSLASPACLPATLRPGRCSLTRWRHDDAEKKHWVLAEVVTWDATRVRSGVGACAPLPGNDASLHESYCYMHWGYDTTDVTLLQPRLLDLHGFVWASSLCCSFYFHF